MPVNNSKRSGKKSRHVLKLEKKYTNKEIRLNKKKGELETKYGMTSVNIGVLSQSIKSTQNKLDALKREINRQHYTLEATLGKQIEDKRKQLDKLTAERSTLTLDIEELEKKLKGNKESINKSNISSN